MLFHNVFFEVFGTDYKAAAVFFGVSSRTCRRWYATDSAPAPAFKLLKLKAGGLIICAESWRDTRMTTSNELLTPYGICKPSDLAFIHKYKWIAKANKQQYDNLKKSVNSENQSAAIADLNIAINKFNQHFEPIKKAAI